MKLVTLIIGLLCLTGNSQSTKSLDSYTASNGITYSVGDEVKLGKGSDTDGKFVYVTIGGWAVSTNPEANRLPAANAGLIVTIKKIKKYDKKRMKKVVLTVGGGNITNYLIDLENAIDQCEIENCGKDNSDNISQETDKYDKIKKLKDLLDDGILTQEEYESEKKKLLEGQ